MSFRDRSKLGKRLQGKSGSEIFDEIRKKMDDDRQEFRRRNLLDQFESPERRLNSLRREAFPCTDDVFNKKSDTSIKSHLEDLAKKHPEFAGDLKCSPWGGTHTVDKSWENARTIPVSVEKNEATASNSHCQPTNEQPQRQNEPSQSTTCQQSSESDSKNTVDFAEQPNKPNQKADNEQERLPSASADTSDVDAQQRAVSRAEDITKQEPKRFMSKVEITPINPYEQPSPSARVEQQQQQQQQQQHHQQQQGNEDNVVQANIKQIPVVSTGVPMADPGSPQMGRHVNNGGPPRDIPVVMEQTHQQQQQQQNRTYMSPQSTRKQPQVRHIPIFVEGRSDPVVTNSMPVEFEQKQNQPDLAAAVPLKRKLDNGNITQVQSTNGPSKQNQSQGPLHPPNQPTQQENASEVSPPHASERPVTPTPPKVLDPMERIQQVQEEVNALTAQVEQFSGTSRSDKEYLYIDEMLTRNLIKLDTIEVEGNDRLRSARKDVIKSIQRSISMLESKVPSLNIEEQPNQTIEQDGTEHLKAEQTAAAVNDAMEIDTSNTCTQLKAPHKVASNDNKTEKNK